MAEEEARAKLEAEEKERREPKSIPVIGGHLDIDEGSNSSKVKRTLFFLSLNMDYSPESAQ